MTGSGRSREFAIRPVSCPSPQERYFLRAAFSEREESQLPASFCHSRAPQPTLAMTGTEVQRTPVNVAHAGPKARKKTFRKLPRRWPGKVARAAACHGHEQERSTRSGPSQPAARSTGYHLEADVRRAAPRSLKHPRHFSCRRHDRQHYWQERRSGRWSVEPTRPALLGLRRPAGRRARPESGAPLVIAPDGEPRCGGPQRGAGNPAPDAA
jgi:hypothetical protein